MNVHLYLVICRQFRDGVLNPFLEKVSMVPRQMTALSTYGASPIPSLSTERRAVVSYKFNVEREDQAAVDMTVGMTLWGDADRVMPECGFHGPFHARDDPLEFHVDTRDLCTYFRNEACIKTISSYRLSSFESCLKNDELRPLLLQFT